MLTKLQNEKKISCTCSALFRPFLKPAINETSAQNGEQEKTREVQTADWWLIISSVGRYVQTQTAHWTVDSTATAGQQNIAVRSFTRQLFSVLAVRLERRSQN